VTTLPSSTGLSSAMLDTLLRRIVGAAEGTTIRLPLDTPPPDLGLRAGGPVPTVWFSGAHDDGEQDVLAGWGAADLITAPSPTSLDDIEVAIEVGRARLPDDAAGFVGGVRFAPHQLASAPWAPWGAAWFLLPAVFVERRAGVWALGAHLPHGRRIDYRAIIESLKTAPLRPVAGRARPPEEDDGRQYRAGVAATLERITAGGVEKVVLAREQALGPSSAAHAAAAVARLALRERRGFGFWLQPDNDAAFFGFSPECLYRRRGVKVDVDALAGTAPRGEDVHRDRHYGEALLASDKDRREHAFVTQDIVRRLGPLCASVATGEPPGLLKQSAVQHLYTPVHARLFHPQPLLTALHPTPAVCGTPRLAAATTLDELEGIDRGLYAGAGGRVTADGETFCVALRCARLSDGQLTAYVGAGIVAGSDPAAEWEETERKLAALRTALTGDRPRRRRSPALEASG
jgi:menaquinone-specific isochorismate synthase